MSFFRFYFLFTVLLFCFMLVDAFGDRFGAPWISSIYRVISRISVKVRAARFLSEGVPADETPARGAEVARPVVVEAVAVVFASGVLEGAFAGGAFFGGLTEGIVGVCRFDFGGASRESDGAAERVG